MKRVKEVRQEKIEKRGHVFNANKMFEKSDKLALKETRDFGQIDTTDHQIEQSTEKAKKQNESYWKSELKREK